MTDDRADDDLLRQEIDARRREDEQAALAESLKAAEYADYYSGRDRDARHYGTNAPDRGWLYGAGTPPSEQINWDKDKERK